MTSGRTPFTAAHDSFLVKYLEKYYPDTRGRQGNVPYKQLTAEENKKKWPWAKQHSWQSWRERYRNKQGWFDHEVLRRQKAKAMEASQETEPSSSLSTREAVDTSPGADKNGKRKGKGKIEEKEPARKRRRVEDEEDVQTAAGEDDEDDGTVPSVRDGPDSVPCQSSPKAASQVQSSRPSAGQVHDFDASDADDRDIQEEDEVFAQLTPGPRIADSVEGSSGGPGEEQDELVEDEASTPRRPPPSASAPQPKPETATQRRRRERRAKEDNEFFANPAPSPSSASMQVQGTFAPEQHIHQDRIPSSLQVLPSPSSSPSTSTRPKSRHRGPPQIVESGFTKGLSLGSRKDRTARRPVGIDQEDLARSVEVARTQSSGGAARGGGGPGRDSNAPEEEEKQWPPKRSRKDKGKRKARAIDDSASREQADEIGDAEDRMDVDDRLNPEEDHHPFSQPTQLPELDLQDDGDVDEDEDAHMDVGEAENNIEHHPFTQPSQLPDEPRPAKLARTKNANQHEGSGDGNAKSKAKGPTLTARRQILHDLGLAAQLPPLDASNQLVEKPGSKLVKPAASTSASANASNGPADHPNRLPIPAIIFPRADNRMADGDGDMDANADDPFLPAPGMSRSVSCSVSASVPVPSRLNLDATHTNAREKGPEQEKPSNLDRDRRKTFGGFSFTDHSPDQTRDIPKLDLLALSTERSFKQARLSLPSAPPTVGSRHRNNGPVAQFNRKQGHRRRASHGSSISQASTSRSTRSRHQRRNARPAEEEAALKLGYAELIKRMAANHGFAYEVAYNVWTAAGGSVERTDALLGMMRKEAEAAVRKVLEQDLTSGTETDGRARDIESSEGDETEEEMGTPGSGGAGLWARDASHKARRQAYIGNGRLDLTRRRARSDEANPNAASSGSKNGKRARPYHSASGLDYYPGIPPLVEESLARYSPPKPSRAAQFVRLSEQGREEDALRRVGQRLSGRHSSGGHRGATVSPSKSPLPPSSAIDDDPTNRASVSPNLTTPAANATSGQKVPSTVAKPSTLGLTKKPDTQKLWSSADDAILRTGEPTQLAALEKRMGKGAVRRRTAQLIAQDAL